MFGEEQDIYIVTNYLPTDDLLSLKGKSNILTKELRREHFNQMSETKITKTQTKEPPVPPDTMP